MYPIKAELFNPALVTEYVNFENFEGFPDKIGLYGDESIHELVYKMIHHFNKREKYWQTYCNAILQAFIIAVVRQVEQCESGIGNPGKVEKIIEYLSHNYMHELNNKQLSQIFHYHPDYISKVILSRTGMTLKQYVIDLRIRSALNTLVYSDMSIKDIAVKAGYDNIHYFTRIFKAKTGFPPGCFRDKAASQLTQRKV